MPRRRSSKDGLSISIISGVQRQPRSPPSDAFFRQGLVFVSRKSRLSGSRNSGGLAETRLAGFGQHQVDQGVRSPPAKARTARLDLGLGFPGRALCRQARFSAPRCWGRPRRLCQTRKTLTTAITPPRSRFSHTQTGMQARLVCDPPKAVRGLARRMVREATRFVEGHLEGPFYEIQALSD